MHTSSHSGWYLLMALAWVNHPQQHQHHPFTPSSLGPAVKEAGQDMSVFICFTVCIFGGAQIQHTSCADKLAIVGLCSSGRIEEISSEDGGRQTVLQSEGSSSGWNVRHSNTPGFVSALTETHLSVWIQRFIHNVFWI